jgi:hypothetical protein
MEQNNFEAARAAITVRIEKINRRIQKLEARQQILALKVVLSINWFIAGK